MKEILHRDPAVQSALVALANAFAMYGTQWPKEYDAGHFDLWRATEAEYMMTRAPYFEACRPMFDAALLADQIAAAANASDSDEVIDGDDEDGKDAAIAISSAIVSLGQSMGIRFTE